MRIKKSAVMMIMGLTLIISMVLGACAPASPTQLTAEKPTESVVSTEENKKPFEGTQITVLLESVPDTEYVKTLAPKFEEETGIKVNFEVLTYVAMYEKLITQLTAGTGNGAYDVIVVDKQWVGGFVGADWLTPLDDYIKKDSFDTSVYIPAMFDMLGQVNNVAYMLPFYNYTMGLYYRTDLFEDAKNKEEFEAKYGSELKVPTNIDEYIQVAEFFTRDTDGNGEIDTYGASQQLARGVGIHAEWANILFGLGGWYYDENWKPIVNNEAGVKAVENMIELYKKGGVPGATAYNFDEQVQLFNQGKAATMYSYSTMYAPLNNPESSKVAGNIGLAVAPGGSGVNGGFGWAIPRSAPSPDAAWEFLKWVESKETAKARADLGGSPVQGWIFSEPDLIEKYPFYSVEQEMLASGKPVPIFGGCAEMVDILARELSLAVAEGKDPQQAMDDAAAEMATLVVNDPLVNK